MNLTDQLREDMRTAAIRGQRHKAEAGLEQILDGADAAELHLRNALTI